MGVFMEDVIKRHIWRIRYRKRIFEIRYKRQNVYVREYHAQRV